MRERISLSIPVRLGARRGRGSRGQSFAELALILPVFLAVILIGLDFGRAMLAWVSLQQTSRIAANFASINSSAWGTPGSQATRTKYRDLIINDAEGINCEMPAPNALPDPTFPGTGPGDPDPKGVGKPAKVTLECTFTLVTPVISALLPDPLVLGGSASFPIRSGALAGNASPGPTPIPAFTCLPTSGTAPLDINCSNDSTNDTAWSWDFGDGATSNLEFPYDATCNCSHRYTTAGTYTVSLVATNVNGPSAPVTHTITVTSPTPGPVANFTFSPPSPIVGQSVVFTDTSSGSPITWSWTFGDAGTSSLQNPSHTYTTSNTFTVSLTVTNANGSDTKTQNITINPAPTCGPVHNFVGETVRTSTIPTIQTEWTTPGFSLQNLFWNPPSSSIPSGGGKHVTSQTLTAGTYQPCSASITLNWQ